MIVIRYKVRTAWSDNWETQYQFGRTRWWLSGCIDPDAVDHWEFRTLGLDGV